MRVAVIGAGIGGLTLAQALRRQGIEVTVYERDQRLADTGGYRLHLAPEATRVLRDALSPAVYQALVGSATDPRTFRQFALLDHALRPLARLPLDGGEHVMIGRRPLRLLLAEGLRVETGREFTGFEALRDRVDLRFADGGTATADVLIGADGVRSRVTRQLSGRRLVRRLTAGGIAGRTPLAGLSVPGELENGAAFVLGPAGMSIFMTAHWPATGVIAVEAPRRVAPIVEEPALLWGLVLDSAPDLDSTLRDAVRSVSAWSSQAGRLLQAADPDSVTAFPYLAANPRADLTPWPSGRVTAMGDAVHAMPPTGGRGAATAIRSAGLLAGHLVSAARGDSTIPLALLDYQRQLPSLAREAVAESLQPLTWMRKLRRPGVYATLRVSGRAAFRVRDLFAPPGIPSA